MLSFKSQSCRNCPVLYYYLYRSITTIAFSSLFRLKRKTKNGPKFLFRKFLNSIFSATLIGCVFILDESFQPIKSLVCRFTVMSDQATNWIRQAIFKILCVVSPCLAIRTFSLSIQNFFLSTAELVAFRSVIKKLAQEKFSHANRFEKFLFVEFFYSVGLVGLMGRSSCPPPGSISPAF